MKKLALCLIVLMQCMLPASVFAEKAPVVHSEAAVLIDGKTGQVLYNKNENMRLYPASITKIATGIIAIEQGNLNDTVTVSKNARGIEGTRVYLLEGEQVSMEDLVYGLLMNSGNDAAVAIAEHMDGSVEKFSERMNQFVASVGATGTHFTNPHGLFEPTHYTTASDMAKIASYAMKNAKFREVVGTKKRPWDGEEWKTTIINHHRLLGNYPGATGIKNGYVDESRHTLVSSAQRDGTEFISVVLKAQSSQGQYDDTIRLLDYGFENFRTATVLGSGQVIPYKGKQYTVGSDIYGTVPADETYHVSLNDQLKLEISTPSGLVTQVDPQFTNEKTIVSTSELQMDRFISASLWIMFILAIGSFLFTFIKRVRSSGLR